MTSRRWTFLFSALTLALLSGCTGNGIQIGGCQNDSNCSDDEICINQECTAMSGSVCSTDSECDFGEVCLDGVCGTAQVVPEQSCTQTAQCPDSQFCDQALSVCVPLVDGMCRNPGQCAQDRPVCANGDNSANAGRCVECLTDAHCGGGGTCINPGVCEGGTGPGPETGLVDCPDNASETAEGCTCNPGYTEDGDRCVADATPEPGAQGPNVPNPEPTPEATPEPTPSPSASPDSEPDAPTDPCEENGWYDDGVCDTFCPLPDPSGDDPEPTPSPASEPDPTPAPTPEPTPTPDPTPEPAGECNSESYCWSNYSFNYTCEDNQCVCDLFYLLVFECESNETVDEVACECVVDQTSAGIAENEPCVQNNQTLQCADGLACIYGVDADGDPSYGSCKQRCTANSECGGRECVLDFLSGDEGICGTPLAAGATGCEQWTAGDSFCWAGPGAEGNAFVDCLGNTCRNVCDWDGRSEPALSCAAAGGTCGAVVEDYPELNIDVATCQ